MKFSPEALSGPGVANTVVPLLAIITVADAEKAEIDPLVPSFVAVALVKVTDPKSASAVRAHRGSHTSGRSTIHSADSCAAEKEIAEGVYVHPCVESVISRVHSLSTTLTDADIASPAYTLSEGTLVWMLTSSPLLMSLSPYISYQA